MTILITGGAGYLGSVLAGQLFAKGERVRVLDSLLYGGEALLGLYPHDEFEFVYGDLRDADAVGRALEGVTNVVHLAAIVGDPACKREPDLAREINYDASLALYERAQDAERFVFASTCSNYGRMGDPSEYVTEESPLQPLSLYAETKVAVELALLEQTNGSGPKTTVLRFATLFGLSPRMRFDLTVNEFAAELALNGRLEVYGEQFWRPYIHVCDAARAVRRVLDAPAETVADEVFNAGDTKENYRKQDLVDILRERLPQELEIEFVKIAEDPRDYRVSFAKIEQALDFRASRTVSQGIDEVLDAVGKNVFEDIDAPRYRN